ncbi:MAG: hypothetical protein GX224_06980 [Thermoplasmatales archaeon]|nr:hypothetical protein [Thermoplasmatales archaeon]
MFGYAVPVGAALSLADRDAYKAYYCESCHQLRDGYGYVSCLATSYEMTLASVILNGVSEDGTRLVRMGGRKPCFRNKRASDTGLMKALAGYTVLVAESSFIDESEDSPGVKSALANLVLGKAARKAAADYPAYADAVRSGYRRLLDEERSGNPDPVRMGLVSAEPMLEVLSRMMGGGFEGPLRELFRWLGVWVYVLDAIEDLDDDYFAGNYNPFLAGLGSYPGKKAFLAENMYSLGDAMGRITGGIQGNWLAVRPSMAFNATVVDNVIFHGVPVSTRKIMSGGRALKGSLKGFMGKASGIDSGPRV